MAANKYEQRAIMRLDYTFNQMVDEAVYDIAEDIRLEAVSVPNHTARAAMADVLLDRASASLPDHFDATQVKAAFMREMKNRGVRHDPFRVSAFGTTETVCTARNISAADMKAGVAANFNAVAVYVWPTIAADTAGT